MPEDVLTLDLMCQGADAVIALTTANTTGSCRIAVRVDNVTQDLWVAVSPPPDR